MKIKECQLVFRYHVFFTAQESQFLRDAGWLHPLSRPETDMWWTEAELDEILLQFPELSGAVDKALKDAKELIAEARKKPPT